MKKSIVAMVVAVGSALTGGCVIAPEPAGYYEAEVAPPLPAVVVLESEPYYQYRGYHYYFHDDRWHYSRERRGPWRELPRNRWPNETRFRERGEGGHRGYDRR